LPGRGQYPDAEEDVFHFEIFGCIAAVSACFDIQLERRQYCTAAYAYMVKFCKRLVVLLP
jgi:hypothetical protein